MRILLLDLDALNPNHLGCYGYHRNTSPHIDQIARKGVRFENYYTSDAPCAPSRTALLSGKFGIHSGVVGHGGTAADFRHEGASRWFMDTLANESLPAFLQANGMKTVLFSSFPERHSQWTFYAGFSEIHNSGKRGMEIAEEVTPQVVNWLEHNGQEENWFLYVNYWDAHTPYRAPEQFGNPFAEEPLPEWLNEEVLELHKQKVGPHGAREINMFDNVTDPNYPRHPGELMNMQDLRQMIDGYDCGIKYLDEGIGQIMEEIKRQGLLDDLVIIITADHGENMGQLGIYGEHGTADHSTCHIPMIIRWPGTIRGHVDHGLHYHLDLGPTIADMMNAHACPSWDGQSYAKALRTGEDSGREYLVLSQCAHVCQRSVRFDDWLYMRTYHDGYHLFPDEMLFNLREDPNEQMDVAEKHRDICKDAVYYLNEWHDRMMHTMPFATDPLWTVMKEGGPFHAKGNLATYIRHLEATDRAHAVPKLIERHPQEEAR